MKIKLDNDFELEFDCDSLIFEIVKYSNNQEIERSPINYDLANSIINMALVNKVDVPKAIQEVYKHYK